METNPQKDTVNEKQNPDQLKHVATGSPVARGVKNPEKHQDDSDKSAEQLDRDAAEEFEQHNMNNRKGYNETPNDVPVEKKNLADAPENTTN
jgi:hypothetical protein